MRIVYLGTGASEGIPAPFCNCEVCANARKVKGREIRSRTGVLIDGKLQIDFSPDLFSQAAALSLDLSGVGTLLVTHTHEDHFYYQGFFTRDACCSKKRRNDVMRLYGNEEAVRVFRGMNFSDSIKRNTQTYEIAPGDCFETDGYLVNAFYTNHMLTEDSLVYLIRKDGCAYLHLVDSPYPDDTVISYLTDNGIVLDGVSMDCTFGTMKDEFFGHMNLNQCVRVKDELQRRGIITEGTKCVLMHISHFSGDTYETFSREAERNGFILAFDGMELTFDGAEIALGTNRNQTCCVQ